MKRASLSILKLVLIGASFLCFSPAQAWWNHDWTVRKKVTIDTGTTGGAISDPIGTSSVLIRLADFDFGAAKEDGSDIRLIAEDDKTPLAFHIEKYDSLLGEAFVWVKVPDLKPGAQTTVWIYYGNQSEIKVPGASDKATYGSDTALVYHFAENGAPAHDSSGQGNDSKTPIPTTASLIGPGLRLNGKVPINIDPSTSLAWNESAPLTWSAWIKPAALQSNAIIFSSRDGAKGFVVGIDNGIPYIDINGTRSAAGAPVAAASWHHLAVVTSGSSTTLYLDGASYATLSIGLPSLTTPAMIGGETPADGSTATGFTGEMDELEITNAARPPGLVKFEALSQGTDSAKTIVVSSDEAAPASWLAGAFGLFGVILKSVTIDGWVVIAILGVMSVISWYVMITKYFLVNHIEKGNALFLKEWRQVAKDLTALDHSEPKGIANRAHVKAQKLIANSTLYRIYHIGSEEIGHRVGNGNGSALSSRSIQAIRASLDGGYVRENHSLNSGMVFLTISIAGGPFMGLLGTVVGVMITFAAIAATGEVNISAIAPGLAAALVATVAGLLVAIPALLGYNYLVSRMKTVTSDMQIFIDEFVTKMAEFYSNSEVDVAHH